MYIDIVTIFPNMFHSVLGETTIRRAIQGGLVEIRLTDLREFTTDKHRSVDDRPYGGGPGMVMRPEPAFGAVEAVLARGGEGRARRLIMTPQGRRLDQALLWELSREDWIVVFCARYEGFDERIRIGLGFEEVSIGDYVLSGGEIPAMVVIEGVVRLIPGVLGDAESRIEESFEGGLLDFPHYTRPAEYRGMTVPEVLLSGNHEEIARWRRAEAVRRTRERRVDLLDGRDTPGGEERRIPRGACGSTGGRRESSPGGSSPP